MARIGKLPIVIPAGVKVAVADGVVSVEGPKGKLSCAYKPQVTIDNKGSEILITPVDSSKVANSYQGLYRQLVNNMMIGVSKGNHHVTHAVYHTTYYGAVSECYCTASAYYYSYSCVIIMLCQCFIRFKLALSEAVEVLDMRISHFVYLCCSVPASSCCYRYVYACFNQ